MSDLRNVTDNLQEMDLLEALALVGKTILEFTLNTFQSIGGFE